MIQKYSLYLVWVIATISSSVTLYLTEVQHWAPCHICWYEQVCMLPLVIIAGMAAWYGFLGIAKYLIPQMLIGLGLSIYQVTIQIYKSTPSITPLIEICKPGCEEMISFNSGLNLPFLSAIAFFLINILLFIILRMSKKGEVHENR